MEQEWNAIEWNGMRMEWNENRMEGEWNAIGWNAIE